MNYNNKNNGHLTALDKVLPAEVFTTKKGEQQFLKTLAAYFPKDFVLPANHDIEEIVIGTVVMDRGAIAVTFPIIRESDFHNPRCRKIYKVCSEMYRDGEGIDLITVTERFRETYGEPIGAYLAEVTNRVVSSVHLETHCRYLKDYSMKRAIVQIGLSAVRAGLDQTTEGTSLFAMTQGWLTDSMATGTSNVPVNNPESIVLSMVKRLDKAVQLKQDITGYRTSLNNVNAHFGGLQPDDLIVLAARPGMGKTSALMSMFYDPNDSEPEPVLIFSLEMNAPALYYKIAAYETGVSVSDMAKGKITESELAMIADKVQKMERSNIHIVDASGLSLEMIVLISRLMHYTLGIKAIGVDYIGLVTVEDKEINRNPLHRVSAVSSGLKNLAKSLHVPVVALSQLSRDVEKRGGTKMPQLSDLRDSGTVEQDADIVIFIHRPEYYKIKDWHNESTEGLALFNIAKYRNGSTTILKLHFDKTTTRFTDTWGSFNFKRDQQVKTISIEPAAINTGDEDIPF